MKVKSLILIGLVAVSSGASAQSRFIMRYTESEPLSSFLARYQLKLERTVANRPIHSVIDPLRRNPAVLIQQISDDTDDDVSIEQDQIVRLPILSFRRPEISGERALTMAFKNTRPTNFFGSSLPGGFVQQLAGYQTNAVPSWGVHGGGSGTVAVIDTGVDGTHTSLSRVVVSGIDLIDRRGTGSELTGLPTNILAIINPTTIPLLQRDFNHLSNGHAPAWERSVRLNSSFSQIPIGLGHGTMVAGAIHLVAPTARILPIRAFGQNGQGRLFHVIEGIHLAEQRGAKVVNLSLNTYTYSLEMERTVNDVSDRGILLVASAGNDGLTNPLSYPARHEKVTSVASVDARNVRSRFSNAGVDVTWVAAPGEGLYLPFPGQRYAGGWGTSFAAPLVSGMAAKLLTRKPDATYSDLQSALGRSNFSPDVNLGMGTLNVFNSVDGF
jgi:subtilisin family serine protease